jgi:3-hydroxybutyrate dehydrogenase
LHDAIAGIGLGIARVLASHGASICLNGLEDADSVERAVNSVKECGSGEVAFHPADLLESSQVSDMVLHAKSQLGACDILVNNAGIQHVASVVDFPLDAWRRVLDLNLTAVFLGTQAVLPGMLLSGYGRIINVASVHGVVGSAGKSAYVAAKHGVVGLTKVTALETAGSGVTANAICPGWVLTPLVQKQCEARAVALGVSLEVATEALLAEKQPSKQFTKPEDLGELAAFLASPAAAQMTGSTQVMDGGWTAQ